METASRERFELVGRVLDRYQLERLIGEGGFGAVYQARHTVTGRRVALKVLLPDDAGADVKTLERFVQEARAAAAIGSPHIVDVLDAGATEDGKHFLVMEFLDGTDLEHLLESEGPIAPERAVDIAVQVLEALGAAHAKDIVHRDLKPGNIYITKRNGREFVKLLDFGISKMLVPDRVENLTKAGIVLGTPHYMAPEQLMASHEVDGRADVWAMATVLYEMVADRRPFEAATVQELFLRVHTEPPTPLAAIAKSVPMPLAQVIERGLARDRDARWGSAAIMADALKRVMRGDLSVLSSGGSTLPAMNTPMPGPDKKLVPSWNSPFPATRDSSTPSPFARQVNDRPTVAASNRPGPRSDRPNVERASGPISQPSPNATPSMPSADRASGPLSNPAPYAHPGAQAVAYANAPTPAVQASPASGAYATPGQYPNPIAPANPGVYPSQPGVYPSQPGAYMPPVAPSYPGASGAYATPGAYAPVVVSQPYAPAPQSGAHPVGGLVTPSLGGFGANPFASGQTAALPSQYPSRPGPISSPSQAAAMGPSATQFGARPKKGPSAAVYFALGVLAVMLAAGAGVAVWIALAATRGGDEVAASEGRRARSVDQPPVDPVELQPMEPSTGEGGSGMVESPVNPPPSMVEPVEPPAMVETPPDDPGMAEAGPVVDTPAMEAEAGASNIVLSVAPLSPTIDRAAAQRSLGALRGSLGACRGRQTENFTIQVMYAQIGGTVMSSEPHPPWNASQAATCAAGVLQGAAPIPGSYGIVRARVTLPAR